jgi:uncharacterized membrane protein YjjP (DUF1212 family)
MSATHPPLTRRELNELVDILLEVGQSLLQAGAASFRTEETMAAIGVGLGAEEVELWVMPTGIIASVISAGEQQTRVVRVGPVSVNMALIAAFDQLSRRVADQGATLDSLRAEVDAIRSRRRELPSWAVVVAVGLACGAFCRNLGGGWPEFAAASIGAGAAQWLKMLLHRLGVNFLILTVACSVAASLMAWLVLQVVPGSNPPLGLIASVLLMVPGVMAVTTVIDLTNYDLVSGVTRGALALIITLSIGVGMLLTLWITGMDILP